MDNVYVVSAVRTAVGKSKRGVLAQTRPDDLAAIAVKGAIEKAGIDPNEIQDVVLGCAFPEAEQGMNVARIAVFRAGLPETVSGVTLNRFCSSGLEAMVTAAAKIQAGLLDVAVAGGVESMSMIPMGGGKPSPNPTLTVSNPAVYIGMGNCGDNVAKDFGITREDADKWALRSNQRAGAAIAANMIKSLEVPTATSFRNVPARLLEVNRQGINNYRARVGLGKVSFTHIIAFAIVRSIADGVPNMNNGFAEDGEGKPMLVRRPAVNLGLAVDVDKGDGSRTLVVPVLRDTQTMDFSTFIDAYDGIIRKVKANKLAVADLIFPWFRLKRGTESPSPTLLKCLT